MNLINSCGHLKTVTNGVPVMQKDSFLIINISLALRLACPTVTIAPLLEAMVAPENSLLTPSVGQRTGSEVRHDANVCVT